MIIDNPSSFPTDTRQDGWQIRNVYYNPSDEDIIGLAPPRYAVGVGVGGGYSGYTQPELRQSHESITPHRFSKVSSKRTQIELHDASF